MADDSDKAKHDAFLLLKFLAKESKLPPLRVYSESGLTLAESRFAIDYLLQRGLIARTSDGFTTLFYVTAEGFKALT